VSNISDAQSTSAGIAQHARAPRLSFFAVPRLLRPFGYLATGEYLKVLDHALLRIRSNQAHNGQFTDMPLGSWREREMHSRTGWERWEAYAARLAILAEKLAADGFCQRARRLAGPCISAPPGSAHRRRVELGWRKPRLCRHNATVGFDDCTPTIGDNGMSRRCRG
jgi:hypothetical protein